MVYTKKLLNLTPGDLGGLNLKELNNIFSKSRLPDKDELDGIYKGTVLATLGSDYLPSLVKKMFTIYTESFLLPWKGKEFKKCDEGQINPVRDPALKGKAFSNGVKGKNILISLEIPIKLFLFEIRVKKSDFDGKDCLLLNYDNRSNPLLIRQIVDELRKVNSNLYLGRCYIKFLDYFLFVNYFCLEKD